METRTFGRLGPVSALSLGGGGIGQVWGETNRAEAVATLREAVDAGISLIDVAPAYGKGEAESVVGETFGGHLPAGIRVSTKCALYAPWSKVQGELGPQPVPPERAGAIIERTLTESLARLRLTRIDILFLHDQLVPDGQEATHPGTTRTTFVEVVRPTFERLLAQGRIGAWGVSAIGVARALIETFNDEPVPYAAQIEVNLLHSRPATGSSFASPESTELVETANQRGVAVMGIRPTQSGALTSGFDRSVDAEAQEYFRRAAAYRALATELGETPAALAHRYALSVPGVSTVTLGVKSRAELREALSAEERGPLAQSIVDMLEASVALGHMLR